MVYNRGMFTLTVTSEDHSKTTTVEGSNRVMLRDYLVAASKRAGLETSNVVENERNEGVIWKGATVHSTFVISEK